MYGKSSNLPAFTKKNISREDFSDWNIFENFKCVTNYPNSRNFSFWRIHKYSPNYIQALLSMSVKHRHFGTEALTSSQIHLAWSLQKKSCASVSFISSIKCYLGKLLTSKSIILISNYDHVSSYRNGWIPRSLHPDLTRAPGSRLKGWESLPFPPLITPSPPGRPRTPHRPMYLVSYPYHGHGPPLPLATPTLPAHFALPIPHPLANCTIPAFRTHFPFVYTGLNI